MVKGINVKAPTPLWMKEKAVPLRIRSIDAVVDVTNYVLLELGQLMHAFDRDRIEGGIVVRMAKEGETLVLLDGSEAKLDSDTLVIADHNKALAMVVSSAANIPALTMKPRTCCWNARSSACCPLLAARAVMACTSMPLTASASAASIRPCSIKRWSVPPVCCSTSAAVKPARSLTLPAKRIYQHAPPLRCVAASWIA